MTHSLKLKQNKDLNLLRRLVEDCGVVRDDTVSVSVEFCQSLSIPCAAGIIRQHVTPSALMTRAFIITYVT